MIKVQIINREFLKNIKVNFYLITCTDEYFLDKSPLKKIPLLALVIMYQFI